jgi:hypothetical protein
MDEIDPSQRLQLDVLEEEYRRRHGVAIEWLKAEVGEGETFQNEVGRAVLSDRGGWFECIDLPMEFSGAAGGPCERSYLSDAELVALTAALAGIAASPISPAIQSLGLLVLYSRAGVLDEREAFVFQTRRGPDGEERRPIRAGEARPGALPALVRCRIDSREPLPGIPLQKGTLVCLRGVGERNLLVLLSHEGEDVRDLGATEPGPRPH